MDDTVQVLGQLFSLLDAPEREKRFNTLGVLKLFLARDITRMSSATRETLTRHLLARLGDDEVAFRTVTSTLFSKLDHVVILPALCAKLASANVPVRSAAERYFTRCYLIGVFSLLTISFKSKKK